MKNVFHSQNIKAQGIWDFWITLCYVLKYKKISKTFNQQSYLKIMFSMI